MGSVPHGDVSEPCRIFSHRLIYDAFIEGLI